MALLDIVCYPEASISEMFRGNVPINDIITQASDQKCFEQNRGDTGILFDENSEKGVLELPQSGIGERSYTFSS